MFSRFCVYGSTMLMDLQAKMNISPHSLTLFTVIVWTSQNRKANIFLKALCCLVDFRSNKPQTHWKVPCKFSDTEKYAVMIKALNSPDKSDTYREALAWRQVCQLQTSPAQVFTDISEDVWSALPHGHFSDSMLLSFFFTLYWSEVCLQGDLVFAAEFQRITLHFLNEYI